MALLHRALVTCEQSAVGPLGKSLVSKNKLKASLKAWLRLERERERRRTGHPGESGEGERNREREEGKRERKNIKYYSSSVYFIHLGQTPTLWSNVQKGQHRSPINYQLILTGGGSKELIWYYWHTYTIHAEAALLLFIMRLAHSGLLSSVCHSVQRLLLLIKSSKLQLCSHSSRILIFISASI